MNQTEEHFLKQIRSSPDDNTVRLVFADWCFENGFADRAEFIKLQFRLEHLLDNPRPAPCEENGEIALPHRRERELLRRHPEWLIDDVSQWVESLTSFVASGGVRFEGHGATGIQMFDQPVRLVFRRGFASELQLETDQYFKQIATRLFRLHPVEAIRFSALEPFPTYDENHYSWHSTLNWPYNRNASIDRSGIDHELFVYLSMGHKQYRDTVTNSLLFYRSRREAVTALGEAAVRMGRVAAGVSV